MESKWAEDTPELSFTELREALAKTDGNLTTLIRALQHEGYVAVAKHIPA